MTATNFPEGFLWGTATAAHQVEGGNWNNDWWAWEHAESTPCEEPSGDACDHLWRYPADIQLLAELGFGAYRFSLEWSRIEPEYGEFSTANLDHYRRMIAACRDLDVLPVVTFHHFTTPRWVVAEGGWENPATADRFASFCERAVGHFGEELGLACTLNEPNIVSLMGWLMGMFPPGRTDAFDAYLRVTDHLQAAHRKAYDALKAGPGDFPVGLTLSMADWAAEPGAEDLIATYRAAHEDTYLEAARGDDFVGVQAYSRTRVGPEGVVGPEPGVERLPMGYEYWPQAAEGAIRHAVEVARTPVYVTENGIGTDDDELRIRYVRDSLAGVARTIEDGLDVRGFFYWSLLDNFEWTFGYRMRFGLVAVDRATQARVVKPSGRWLADVVRANRID
ncbi:MAG TPA: glycoside hydrolase family 1 protein [Acidimicrobiia bacterium]|nr:glycoside hydrolase family 1 protein [Acidimicrobiia bacterium]HEV3451633.1 glycoside hydrolase family 1 protein [Acidimicrobiia bacterium]